MSWVTRGGWRVWHSDLGWGWGNNKPASDLSRTVEDNVPRTVEYGVISFLQKETRKGPNALTSGLGVRAEF